LEEGKEQGGVKKHKDAADSFAVGGSGNGALRTVLLDGATMHTAGATFQRLKNNLRVRPINVLGLISLIEAYIMFDNFTVRNGHWDYFSSMAPDEWTAFLKEACVTIDEDPFAQNTGLKEFLSEPSVFWIINF